MTIIMTDFNVWYDIQRVQLRSIMGYEQYHWKSFNISKALSAPAPKAKRPHIGQEPIKTKGIRDTLFTLKAQQ